MKDHEPQNAIVQFKLPPDDEPQCRKAKPPARNDSSCKHKRLIINQDERTVTCAECEKDVDPFTALGMWCDYNAELDSRIRSIKRYEEAKAERQERLKLTCKHREAIKWNYAKCDRCDTVLQQPKIG